MKATRITLAAALAVSLAACSAGSPTAPARDAAPRRADTAAGDTTHAPTTTTSTDPVPPPPPGDGKSPILGSGG